MSGLVDQLTKRDPVWKSVDFAGGGTTATIWTPTTSTRIVLTGLDISIAGASTGTVLVFFGSGTGGSIPARIGMYALSTSSTISPRFPGLMGKYDIVLSAVSNITGAFTINAQGFEVP